MNKLLRNPMFTGFMLGILLPMIAFMCIYYFKHGNSTFNDFADYALSKSHLPTYIKSCVFINLPFFLLFNFMKRFEVCIGLFMATIGYGLFMLIVRYLM